MSGSNLGRTASQDHCSCQTDSAGSWTLVRGRELAALAGATAAAVR